MYQTECGFKPGDVILATDPGCHFFRVVFEVNEDGDKELAALGLDGTYQDEVVSMLWLMEGGEFGQVSRVTPFW